MVGTAKILKVIGKIKRTGTPVSVQPPLVFTSLLGMPSTLFSPFLQSWKMEQVIKVLKVTLLFFSFFPFIWLLVLVEQGHDCKI